MTFIRNHMRHRKPSETQEETKDSEPNPYDGMSEDNKALCNLLAQYINQNVEQRIEIHMQSLIKKIENLTRMTENLPHTESHEVSLDDRDRNVESAGEASHSDAQMQEVRAVDTQVNDIALQVQNSEPERPPDPPVTADKTEIVTVPAELQSNVTADTSNQGKSSNNVLSNLESANEEAAKQKEQVIIDKLKGYLKKTETIQGSTLSKFKSITNLVEDMSVHKKDTILDTIMAAIILLNSIVIGISMDHESPAIDVIDLAFTVTFIIELIFKFRLHGIREHFRHGSNIFDFFVVSIDIFQLMLELANVDLLSNTPAASLFRVVRLVRLVRLIRLARLQMLDDLVALISGMVGGMTTLLWSVVLFFLILYITSLLFREFFGQSAYMINGEENMTLYFNTVPRCMLTVFRFFFGDFSTISGLNIFEGIQDAYGSLAAVLVCVFFFMITIGLFNVIAAIFVESTLAAANHAQIMRKTERMNDESLWATRLSLLVRKMFEYNDNALPNHLSQVIDSLADQTISEGVFQEFMRDHHVIKALNDLEIDESDHKYLFDILDNDNTGSILISQLSDGLERLRGDPRRSDIICVDLMVRSIQQQTDFLCQAAKANVRGSAANRKKMEENRSALHKIEAMLHSVLTVVNPGDIKRVEVIKPGPKHYDI